MKTIKRFGSLLLALTLILSLGAVTALAANYTAVTGTSMTFNKYLVMSERANVPKIDFEFSIEAGSAIPAANGKMEVISPGADTGVIGSPAIKGTDNSTAKASYTPAHDTVTSADGVTINSGEKAAVEQLTVDFSSVSFAEPGIYRYLIKETSADQQGITYDTQATTPGSKQRVLDVYVTDSSGSLKVSAYVLHETAGDVPAGDDNGSNPNPSSPLSDKSKGFVNTYATQDLTFGKAVAGNQGSRDKYFKFTVAATQVNADNEYTVLTTGAEAEPMDNAATKYNKEAMKTANNVTVLTGQQLLDGYDFYLKHGQYITIQGLERDATYSVTEDAEDYKQSNGASGITVGSNPLTGNASDTVTNADIYTGFTNTRNGVIPTGILTVVGPAVAVIALAVVGLGIVVISRSRREEAE